MDRPGYLTAPRLTEAEALAIAEARWQCKFDRISGAGEDEPQLLFTRPPSVEAIGVGHYREVPWTFHGVPTVDFSPELWQRARFLCGALAFVSIVNAPNGVYFATIKDFDKDAERIKARQLGVDSKAKWSVSIARYKELKPDGAKIGPGSRNE